MAPMKVVALRPPTPGSLTLYLGGHGYGESQVVVTPDGHVIVVDTCAVGHHVPLDLMHAFGLARLDMLVVTHADLDHCSGVPQLVEQFPPERVMYFPPGSMAEVLARVLQHSPDANGKLGALRETLTTLDKLASTNLAYTGNLNTEMRSFGDVTVRCIAPCGADVSAVSRQISGMINWDGDAPTLAARVSEFLAGPASNPSERNNSLSLALTIAWKQFRIVLGGDVESRHENRGWAGILKELERDDRLHELKNPTVVKVAHHGSMGAFHSPTWDLHTADGHRPIALLTSYQRGAQASRPPTNEFFHHMALRASATGATAPPVPNDWSAFASNQVPEVEPDTEQPTTLTHWVGVEFKDDGSIELMGSTGTRWASAP
jgi:hypothetical protein